MGKNIAPREVVCVRRRPGKELVESTLNTMESLKSLAIEKVPKDQLMKLMEMYYVHFREYFPLVEACLTYWEMKKWSDSLPWNHPVARRLCKKMHQHEFRGM